MPKAECASCCHQQSVCFTSPQLQTHAEAVLPRACSPAHRPARCRCVGWQPWQRPCRPAATLPLTLPARPTPLARLRPARRSRPTLAPRTLSRLGTLPRPAARPPRRLLRRQRWRQAPRRPQHPPRQGKGRRAQARLSRLRRWPQAPPPPRRLRWLDGGSCTHARMSRLRHWLPAPLRLPRPHRLGGGRHMQARLFRLQRRP